MNNREGRSGRARWSDGVAAPPLTRPENGVRYGDCLVETLAVYVPHPPAEAFKPIQRIGGGTGWYYANWLWRLRGILDMLLGGVGLRRGRPDPERLQAGDPVDCWRVEAFQQDRLLRLLAEMRVPGRAWLQFEVVGNGSGAIIRQTAIFDPVGFFGLMYWYLLYPVHRVLFAGMLRGIVKAIGNSGKT